MRFGLSGPHSMNLLIAEQTNRQRCVMDGRL